MKKLKVKKLRRGNPMDPHAPHKWYLTIEHVGTISGDELMNILMQRSRLNRGVLLSTFDTLLRVLPELLTLGFSVELPGIGHFRLTIQSEGSDSEKECTSRKIKKLNIHFLPSRELKDEVMHNA